MGSRMATNLLKNKMTVTVYNRSKQPVEALIKEGAIEGTSFQQAVTRADIVFTMLSKPEVVEEIAIGKEGFLKAMKPGSLWVDCSTVNPSFSVKENEWAQNNSVRFMDIPVAGSLPQAADAALIFIAGGTKEDLEEVTPLLNLMGSKIIHAGDVGKGATLKILVNAMLAQSMLVFAETVVLGEKLGLDKNFLLDTLPAFPVAPPFIKAKAEKMRQNNYEVQFPLEHMQKDLQLVSITAYENNQPMYLANLAKDVYAAALKEMGKQDFSAVYAHLLK